MEDRLKKAKETLMCAVENQLGHLDTVDAKELGEVVDMVKDFEEAIYYCTISKAMEEQSETRHRYYNEPYYRDMDRERGRMYYGESPRMYTEPQYRTDRMSLEYPYDQVRDRREGRSPHARRMYMETKEMQGDKATQMKELEKYMHDLTEDIMEMLEDTTPEERQVLSKKVSDLGTKIAQAR